MEIANQRLSEWRSHEEFAESIVPLVGALYRRQALVVAVFGTNLVQKTPIEILRVFNRAGRFAGITFDLNEVTRLLELMGELQLGRARVDIGKLLVRRGKTDDFDSWARRALEPLTSAPQPLPSAPRDVVLYGFGRVGRLIARVLVTKTGGGDKHRLRAIVLRPPPKGVADLERRASLLGLDSVHGPFEGTIEVDHEHNAIIANGNMIHVIYANQPDEPDYAAFGIRDAVVIDNTGKWRNREGLGRHLACPGAGAVILTAPGQGDVPNLVYGINHASYDEGETIFSAASCTTNAIVPVLKVVHDAFGIRRGHVETIHAYTNDQNLLDNFHKKDRRGRGAPLNMVITSTGAAKAVAKALPELAGRLSGSAIRVPTPNVSLAILQLELDQEVSREALNEHLRQMAMDSPLEAQIYYTVSPEVVSTDMVGNHHASIVDSVATIADGGRNVILYVWYDNEFGYSCQVVRLFQHIAGISPRVFPSAASA